MTSSSPWRPSKRGRNWPWGPQACTSPCNKLLFSLSRWERARVREHRHEHDRAGPHPDPLPLTQEREKTVCRVRLRTVSLPRLYGARSAPCELFCVFSLSRMLERGETGRAPHTRVCLLVLTRLLVYHPEH